MSDQATPPGDRLEAVAEWFTEAKNLWLERLPVGLIADLRAGAAALRAQAWQPIESAPKDGRWLLGWHHDFKYFVFRDGPGLVTGEDPMPTHWMPLPLPPAGPQEPSA